MATINVDESTKEGLKKYCTRNKITQGNFVKFALDYFQKSGIDPASPPESVKEELSKMTTRISQLIAFQKTFEKDQLLPLVRRVSEVADKVATYGEVKSTMRTNYENTLARLLSLEELVTATKTAVAGVRTNGETLQGKTTAELNTLHAKLTEMARNVSTIIEFGSGVGVGNSISKAASKSK